MPQSRQGIGKHRLAADFSPTVPQLRSLLRLVLDPEGQAERAKTPLLDSGSRLFPETPSVELRVELSLFPCLCVARAAHYRRWAHSTNRSALLDGFSCREHLVITRSVHMTLSTPRTLLRSLNNGSSTRLVKPRAGTCHD